MGNDRVRILAEVGLAVALSAALNLFRITLPINIAGGSISLDMVPIFVVALRRGLGPGMMAGALWGVLDLAFDPFVVHPAQLVLDYPVAFALCGLSGLGSKGVNAALAAGRFAAAGAMSVGWVLVGGLGRFSAHLVSGAVFFAENAPAGQPVWLYSAVYNMSYLAPSLFASALAVSVIVPALGRAVPVGYAPDGKAAA